MNQEKSKIEEGIVKTEKWNDKDEKYDKSEDMYKECPQSFHNIIKRTLATLPE